MPHSDKEFHKKYQREWKANRREAYFSGKCCVLCGSKNRLELDHIDSSTKASHKIWSWSEERRLSELAKCQILCYSCHKKKSSEDRRNRITHGTISGYNRLKCRCSECKEANRLRTRNRRLLISGVPL